MSTKGKKLKQRNFYVKIRKDSLYCGDGEVELVTSSNGYQWNALSLTPSELVLVKSAIEDYLSSGSEVSVYLGKPLPKEDGE